MVGQTSDLLTQDATQVSVRSQTILESEGYEPKAESSQFMPAGITPKIVARSMEAITTAFKGRSNSFSETPSQTLKRLPVSQRQSTGNPPILNVYACNWTSFSNANQVDFPSVTGGAQQQVATE
eukprot:4384142-Amphidinium_carterae.1